MSNGVTRQQLDVNLVLFAVLFKARYLAPAEQGFHGAPNDGHVETKSATLARSSSTRSSGVLSLRSVSMFSRAPDGRGKILEILIGARGLDYELDGAAGPALAEGTRAWMKA